MKRTIFVIDDEKDIREILQVNFSKEGYAVVSLPSAEDAMRELDKAAPDLIVLDIMMPGMGGYEFCKKLRSSPKYMGIPIIFLSAKSEEFDKVLGLELGGDDYITKPFSLKELLSRVKAVMRRYAPEPEAGSDAGKISYRGIELNPDKYQLLVDGAEVKLTRTEFEMLHLFIKNPGKIFTRDNIINSVKGHDVYVVDRTIDVHIMNLRKKLGPYKNTIATFSGVGYGFKEL